MNDANGSRLFDMQMCCCMPHAHARCTAVTCRSRGRRIMLLTVLLGAAALTSTQNLTVYRITPQNYTGVRNMDTGDAAGDVFFG
jgi:hypothetical protein